MIVDAESSDYDMEKIAAMLHKIVAAATGWMDDRPFDSYMFLYHFPRGPGGGGMEHAYSTAISLNAEALARAPEALASVTAHEFFHLWNVKRIRPQTLEPIDYTKENYTRALWFSEGCTGTAGNIIRLRAGLLDEWSLRAARWRAGSENWNDARPTYPVGGRVQLGRVAGRRRILPVTRCAASPITTRAISSESRSTCRCAKPVTDRPRYAKSFIG